jgi:hypothetical protein
VGVSERRESGNESGAHLGSSSSFTDCPCTSQRFRMRKSAVKEVRFLLLISKSFCFLFHFTFY